MAPSTTVAGVHLPVLIVDDHALVATTLMMALTSSGIETSVVADPSTAAAVRFALDGRTPGLALVDLDLGTTNDGRQLNGVDLVPVLIELGWRVVILTGNARESEIAAAVAAGAIGWLSKIVPFGDLLDAVRDAVAGRAILPDADRLRLIRLHYEGFTRQRLRRAGLDQLTAREREVLDELVIGKRAAAIAEESVVSLTTVRAQIRSILTKLGVSSQLEAVALLREVEGT
jgi:two-component system, NarL family, nitrate/nitrite response regulator NarL